MSIMTDPNQLPYAEEAKLYTEIIDFFTERLPHVVGDTAEHLDEAALTKELFEVLSTETDEELAGLGISREEISKVAAAASGLFVIANNRQKRS
jgi:hypothetical protein